MAYSEITKESILPGKKPSVPFWQKVKDNFDAHETQIAALEGGVSNIPVGAILIYGSATPPADHLLCDGSEVSRSTYSDLFTVLGVTFGAGNGTTTFNLPDLKGRAPMGVGTGSSLTARAMGDKTGTETHALITSEMPSHTHSVTDPGHTHTSSFIAAATVVGPHITRSSGAATTERTINTSTDTTGVTIADTGGDDAHENMAPYLVCPFIIRAVA